MIKEPVVQKRPFPVTGMTCGSCAVNIERTLQRQPGVVQASVNYADSSALVEYKPALVTPLSLRKAVTDIGYDLLIPEREYDDAEVDPALVEAARATYTRALRRRTFWAIGLALPQVVIGMGGMYGLQVPYHVYVLWLLATPVVALFGRPFYVHAWQQARHRRANMDTLVAISTGAAYLLSVTGVFFPRYFLESGFPLPIYFESASVVIAFILLGKLLEDRAKASAGTAIRHLMALQPAAVTLDDGQGGMKEVPLKEVSVGQLLLVRPGERIPVDGVIESGGSYIDESMLTGEPMAVPREAEDKVYAGTLNQDGAFRFRATGVGKDTLLCGIIRNVREAQGSKAPVQRLVDKVAGIFVPIVIGIAVASFIAWWLFGGLSVLPHAFLSFVAVLVIACPCALGLATPTAIMVGIGKGAENGIFIKDAESLERLRKITDLVIDKTGTLTEGKPEVVQFLWFGGTDGAGSGVSTGHGAAAGSPTEASPRVKAVLYNLERASGHPLAEAICRALSAGGAPGPAGAPGTGTLAPAPAAAAPAPVPLEQVLSVPGSGIQANYGGGLYMVGNARWLTSRGLSLPAEAIAWAAGREEEANTVVFFSRNRTVLAGIALRDKIRPAAAALVRELQAGGIVVHLVTGDNASAAAAVARETGIRSVHAGVLPSGKADFIRSLQAQAATGANAATGTNAATGANAATSAQDTTGAADAQRAKRRIVAMAGDGINDAAALVQADVGIAMGGGADIAMDVAGMTLVQADLSKIPVALRLSRRTIRTVRENLFFAFIYNVIGIPVAAGLLYPLNGFVLSPMIAGAAMALSSLTVVGNSLRLKSRNFNLSNR
jgi:Cu2+-exporting ATPase